MCVGGCGVCGGVECQVSWTRRGVSNQGRLPGLGLEHDVGLGQQGLECQVSLVVR